MAKEQIAVAELVLNMILGKTGGTRVDYFPQKPDFPFDAVYEQAFVRATPESQGISSDLFAALLRELDASKDTEMHHFMALRHGKVICECNFAPYPKGMWHITHSMCKSITGMAIGMLIEEEKLKLDENIYDIFPDHINAFSKIFRPVITVENLLTIPFSPLKIQLAKFCHVFCTEKKSPAAFCNSFRTGFPVIFRDTKRTKQSRSQIFGQGFSCTFRHDCRKNISIQTVILKLCSGFSIDRCIQKTSKPVISGHDT